MRIVSLLAAGTEIVAALGALDDLVGRSHECDWPPEVQHLPALSQVQIDVQASSAAIDEQIKTLSAAARYASPDALAALSPYRIDIDRLRALRPDVVLTQMQCEVCAVSERDVMAALARATDLAPRVVSLSPHRLQDIWGDIVRVGRAIGREDAARDLVARLEARLAALGGDEKHALRRVAVLEWLDPLMGAGNWMPELIAAAGGEPVFGEVGQHSPWIAWDELHAADPDVIVLAPCGFTLERTLQEAQALTSRKEWRDLRAGRANMAFAADGNAYFNRSGPRLVETAEIVHAMCFSGDAHRESWTRL
jgi:iron complex transport system substrate-binding protein